MEFSFGLVFHLKKTGVSEEGKWPVYMRITSDGKYAEVSTKRKCHPNFWMVGPGRMRGKTEDATAFDMYLDMMQLKVLKLKEN